MITTLNHVFSLIFFFNLHQVKTKEACHTTLERCKRYSSFVDRNIDLVTLIFSLTEEERTRLEPQQEKMINHLKIQRQIQESKIQR